MPFHLNGHPRLNQHTAATIAAELALTRLRPSCSVSTAYDGEIEAT